MAEDGGDFTESLIIIGDYAFMGVILIVIAVRNRNEKQDAGNLYGSTQYAEQDEIRESGLLPQKGEKGKGIYVVGWINPKDGQQYYLRHNGKTCNRVTPTRSDKGRKVSNPDAFIVGTFRSSPRHQGGELGFDFQLETSEWS